MDEPRPEVRIGDRERREVDARLQRAYADGVLTMTEYEERSGQCWAARTRSELAPLTADLPDAYADPDAEPAPTGKPVGSAVAETEPKAPEQSTGRKVGSTVAGIALLGAALFGGSQVFFADDGFSAFGGNVVNVAADDDRVDVGYLFGGARVIVPTDARVQIEGVRLFGGTDCQAACDGSGTRDVVVDASGAFGGLTVQRVGEQMSDNNNNNDNNNNDNNNDNNNSNDDDEDDDED